MLGYVCDKSGFLYNTNGDLVGQVPDDMRAEFNAMVKEKKIGHVDDYFEQKALNALTHQSTAPVRRVPAKPTL
jgi:hypothetical protein